MIGRGDIEQNIQNENKRYIFLILKIILLTNIPAVGILFTNFKGGIGWILGSLSSAANFYWMAHSAMAMLPVSAKANAVRTSKTTIVRMLCLAGWCVFVMAVIKPDLVTFCVSLLTAQIAIFLHHFYSVLKNGKLKKYFDRGNDV